MRRGDIGEGIGVRAYGHRGEQRDIDDGILMRGCGKGHAGEVGGCGRRNRVEGISAR